jgi:hypothetical protein
LAEKGLNTHFYSMFESECSAIFDLWPGYWMLESQDVFEIYAPHPETGDCLPGTTPVYRLYDNRPDANHRYTTSIQTVQDMVSKGWIPEGYGQRSVGMCALPAE